MITVCVQHKEKNRAAPHHPAHNSLYSRSTPKPGGTTPLKMHMQDEPFHLP